MAMMKAETRDQILSGLKAVIDEAQQLLTKAEDRADRGMSSTRERVSSSMRSARDSLSDMQDTAMSATRDAAVTTDRYVKSNPWKTVAVGALVGVGIGMLLSRR